MSPARSRSGGGQRARKRRAAPARSTPDRPDRQALLVLGMHRSGTSALTGVLGLAGASLPRYPMEASQINARGFFESVPIYHLHEEMLEGLGTSWDDLSPLPDGWMRSGVVSRYVDRMAELVREEFGDAPLFVVKDPRVCRLVPFWLSVLDRLAVEPSFVVSVRNPLEVSASLARAQEVDEKRGRLLWLEHFLLAERDTRGRTRCFVTYPQLLDDWRAVLGRISDELDLALPALSRRAGAEIDAFLTDTLRHHEISDRRIDDRSDVTEWVKTAYHWAERAASGRSPSTRTLDRVADAFFAAEAAFGPIVATSEHDRREHARRAEQLEEQLEEQRAARALEPQPPAGGLESRMDDLADSMKKMLLLWAASARPPGEQGAEQLERVLAAIQAGEPETIAEAELVQLAAYRESAVADAQVLDRVRDLEIQLAERQREIERLAPIAAEVDATRARAIQLEADVDRGRERAEQITSRLSDREAELQRAGERVAGLESELTGLRRASAELSVVRDQLEATERARESSERKVDDLGLELGGLRRLEPEVERLRESLEGLSEEREVLRSTSEEHARRAETFEAQLAELRAASTAEREAEQAAFEAMRVELENRIAQTSTELAAHAERETAWTAREAELAGRLTEAEAQLASQSAELEQLQAAQRTVQDLEQSARGREVELRRLRAEAALVPKLRERYAENEATLERLREEMESVVTEQTRVLRGALEVREAEIARLRRVASDLPAVRARLEERENALEIAASSYADLKRHADGVERELEASRQAAAAAAREREDRARVEEAQAHLPHPFVPAPAIAPPAASRVSRLLGLPRRLAKIVWWSLRLELPTRLRERRIVARIRESGLFDEHFYRAHCADVADPSIDPIMHYVRHGAAEGRNPSGAFDTDFYLDSNPDVGARGLNPLDHFASHGWREGRRPHPYFDVGYYLATNPDVAASGENPLRHWLHLGAAEGRRTIRRSATKYEARLDASRARRSEGTDPTPAAASSSPSVSTRPPKRLEPARVARLEASLDVLDASPTRRGRAGDPIVLVATHELPHPPRAGNQYRISRYVSWLTARGYQVITVYSPLPGDEPTDAQLRDAAVALENLVVCRRDGRLSACVAPHLERLLEGLDGRVIEPFEAGLEPFDDEDEDAYRERVTLEQTFCPDVLVRTLLHLDERIEGPAAVISNYVWLTRYLPHLRDETLRIIDTHDMFSSKAKKVHEFGISNELSLTEAQERQLLLRGQVTMAIQASEAREFERIAPERPVVTVGVDFDRVPESATAMPAAEQGPTLALVGSANPMNAKGVSDFLRHSWPLIRRDHPEVTLLVAGAVGDCVPTGTPNVEVLGKVESLDDLYHRCHVVINPTAAGTGLKIKTVEALAHHRPIVTWPLGVDGVPEPLLRFCRIAHDWYEFYLQVVRALDERAGRDPFSDEDRSFVVETLSAGNIYRLLGDELDRHCRVPATVEARE